MKIQGGPDSFLSWIIAVSCGIIYFVVFGTNRANGLLFLGLKDENPDASREDLSWPFQLIGSSIVFAAPMTGFLSTRYSDRSIAIIGSLIFSLGSAVCFFSTNVILVSVFYGLIRGTGLAMATTAVPSLINDNFKRHRATAIGIAYSGTPAGGFVFPLVVQYCLDEYGLKGTFLLMGGMSLHAAIGAVALTNYNKKSVMATGRGSVVTTETANNDEGQRGNHETKNATNNASDGNYVQGVVVDSLGLAVPVEIVTSKAITNGVCNPGFEKDDYDHTVTNVRRRTSSRDSNNDTKDVKLNLNEDIVGKSSQSWSRTVANTDASNSRTEKPPKRVKIENKTTIYHIDVQTETSYSSSNEAHVKRSLCNALAAIFTSGGFYLISLTNLAVAFALSSYTLLMVDYALDKNIERHNGVFLLSSCAAGEIAGRLMLGWITDRNYVTRPIFLFVTLLITGGMMTVMVFFENFIVLVVCSVIFGASQGAALNVANVMWSDYIAKEDIQIASSFSRSIIGMSFLPRAPLIGVFRDGMGSYDNFFHLVSGLFYASAFSWLMEERIRRKETRLKSPS